MPAIEIVCEQVEMTGGGDMAYSGKAYCDGMTSVDEPITWYTEAAVDASILTKHEAMRDAAIAAALDQKEITVGLLDQKTLIGGVVLL